MAMYFLNLCSRIIVSSIFLIIFAHGTPDAGWKFHNERAIYQAEHLGLDVENIQAYNAKDPKSRRAYLTTIREYFARVKMFMDLITYDDKSERE